MPEGRSDGAADAPSSSTRRRVRWAGGVAVLVLVGVVGGGAAVADRIQARQKAQDAQDAVEPTAWEERQELESVLPESAGAAGLEGEVEEDPYGPFHCVRTDGREGVAYSLAKVRTAPVEDVGSFLDEVESHWQRLGYATGRSEIAGYPAVRAVTERGSQVRAFVGPRGAGLAGETGCFLTDGAPGQQ